LNAAHRPGLLHRPRGWTSADLFNRYFSILAIWMVALFCVLYKRAERRSLDLAAIVKSFGDAIISKSLGGVITTWNPGAERLFGYTAEEILGRPVTRLFAPEQRDEESRTVEAINRGGTDYPLRDRARAIGR
jgi:PAS domain-containing protein